MNTAPVHFGAKVTNLATFLFQLAVGWLSLNWSIFTAMSRVPKEVWTYWE